MEKINNKTVEEWISEKPLLKDIIDLKEVYWINPNKIAYEDVKLPVAISEIERAEKRLKDFAPFLLRAYPELEETGGLIESPIREIDAVRSHIKTESKILLKEDSLLPIAGSIKARGGIYEILKYTEELALKESIIEEGGDYSVLYDHKDFFKKYKIQVGSTGNLGLSIGIISAEIGYEVIVHMSKDAQEWKKNLLREKGVNVVEYDSDFTYAVAQGRKKSDADPLSYFVDDENSLDLFLGYAVAPFRLKKQLDDLGIIVDADHPLVVHLPAGVGGGPGGIAYGLKAIYGDNVHPFFVEPVNAASILLGMYTGLYEEVAVKDFGIDGITIADGLAVGRASDFIMKTMEPLLSGIYTIEDLRLPVYQRDIYRLEDIYLEPSSCAGLLGPILFKENLNDEYFKDIDEKNITHIIWGTGGGLVPEEIKRKHLEE